jgi:hypothetical protein
MQFKNTSFIFFIVYILLTTVIVLTLYACVNISYALSLSKMLCVLLYAYHASSNIIHIHIAEDGTQMYRKHPSDALYTDSSEWLNTTCSYGSISKDNNPTEDWMYATFRGASMTLHTVYAQLYGRR